MYIDISYFIYIDISPYINICPDPTFMKIMNLISVIVNINNTCKLELMFIFTPIIIVRIKSECFNLLLHPGTSAMLSIFYVNQVPLFLHNFSIKILQKILINDKFSSDSGDQPATYTAPVFHTILPYPTLATGDTVLPAMVSRKKYYQACHHQLVGYLPYGTQGGG